MLIWSTKSKSKEPMVTHRLSPPMLTRSNSVAYLDKSERPFPISNVACDPLQNRANPDLPLLYRINRAHSDTNPRSNRIDPSPPANQMAESSNANTAVSG